MSAGSRSTSWTTLRGAVVWDGLQAVLDRLAAAGVRRVRLGAFGYAVKTPGLTSFMTLETFRFIDEVTAWCHDRNLDLLVEVHSYYQQQVAIACEEGGGT